MRVRAMVRVGVRVKVKVRVKVRARVKVKVRVKVRVTVTVYTKAMRVMVRVYTKAISLTESKTVISLEYLQYPLYRLHLQYLVHLLYMTSLSIIKFLDGSEEEFKPNIVRVEKSSINIQRSSVVDGRLSGEQVSAFKGAGQVSPGHLSDQQVSHGVIPSEEECCGQVT
jgi:hypothetical protein